MGWIGRNSGRSELKENPEGFRLGVAEKGVLRLFDNSPERKGERSARNFFVGVLMPVC